MKLLIDRNSIRRSWLARLLQVTALCVAFCSAGLLNLSAAPFDQQIGFTQPDGTRLQLHGKGDEFSAVFETLDGYTVVFDQAQKAYCFAERNANGQLVSTGVQAQRGNPVALGLAKNLRMSAEARKAMVVERYRQWDQQTQNSQRWSLLKENARAYNEGLSKGEQFSPPPFTTVGTKAGLTILVDFSDDVATIPQAEIINYANGDNYTGFGNNGSVKKYYQDVSGGKLTYTNVVTVYIRAPKAKTVYNDVSLDAGTCGNTLLKDVIDTMKALPNYATTIAPTFDALTTDNNNYVVACNVFFAGANSGVWPMGLWPHSSSLYQVGAQDLESNGKKVFRYQITDISSRLTIGTFCHENGHMLCGYPDLYDYEYDSAGGAGDYCLMGSGAGDVNPAQICAYLKRASGWATTVDVGANSALTGVLTAPRGTNFNTFYRFEKPGTPTEYYLMENRQKTGRDSAISGSGIALWHVDELGDRDNQSLAYNGSHANYELTLVQADNQWHLQRGMNNGDANDLYYEENGSSGYQNEFSDSSAPSARWWDGANSGVFFAEFSPRASTMTVKIGYGLSMKVSSTYFLDANANHLIDFNECSDLYVVLTNTSMIGVTNLSAILATTTPGVLIASSSSGYPNVAGGNLATNLVAFKVSTAPTFNCGQPIEFQLFLKSEAASATNSFTMQTGTPGMPVRFESLAPVAIPDNSETNSTIAVTNISFAVNKVSVGVYITHTYDADLQLQLISPDGVTNTLSRFRGNGGQNYGLACSPDSRRTIFDDAAPTAIGSGVAPFLGFYKPEQPLSIFNGKSGTNVNGIWKLRVLDASRFDFGRIQCWSLDITPTICTDGLGECPGSDLAVGITAAPEPVMVGQTLIYTLSVTNRGPSSAKNVTVSQLLPGSVLYQSATSSQGGSSVAGNVLTCNLGQMAAGGRATVNVTVLPTTAGLITASATVSSEQPDFDLFNNTAVFISNVNPPTSDLAVGLASAPVSTVLGSPVVYTVSVTNKGPSTASGVVVTNNFFPGVVITSSGVSQGASFAGSNMVICSFGGLASGARATASFTVQPLVEGTISVVAQGSANQYDPVIANNTARILTAVGPSSDLSVSIVASQNPVVTRNNLTLAVTVTNGGPSLSSAVMLNTVLPPSFTLVGVTNSQGSSTSTNGSILTKLGTILSGGTATVWINVTPFANGTNSVVASVAGSQPDPNSGNNAVSLPIVVAPPFINIVAAGSALTAESYAPANGSIDNGETVTAVLRLRNGGNVTATNITATLLMTNGISAPTLPTPRDYPTLMAGGFSEGQPFTFTASGTTSVVAVLRISQGGVFVTNLSFTFTLPSIKSFANTQRIVINDNSGAAPYPSTINVSGVSGVVGKVAVSLAGFTHTFPQDVDVLLVGPSGQKVILMSGAGQGELANSTLTFDDSAAAALPDAGSQIVAGTWRPGNYLPAANLPAPAPANPYGSSLAVFNNGNANGIWKLFIADHTAGDVGEITGGWSLAISLLTPVNQVSDLAVSGTASEASTVAGGRLTYQFTVTNGGPNPASEVAFTNVLPVGVTLVTNAVSQGSLAVQGQTLLGNLGSLAVGASARVSLTVSPSAAVAGLITNSVSVSSPENDLNLLNNAAAIITAVTLPSADLAVSQAASSNPIITTSNVTFTVSITNNGPDTALESVVTDVLPVGLTVTSISGSQGSSWENTGTSIVWTLGSLASGATATLTIEGNAADQGLLTNLVSAATVSIDAAQANNSTSLELAVVGPTPQIVTSGALLISESGPVNGTVDPGETVTVALGLKNVGSAPTAGSVVASVVNGGGITSQSEPQDYGVLGLNGQTVSKPFTFTADSNGVTEVVATLALTDGTNAAGSVSYTFLLPSKHSFATTATATIPDHGTASVYPISLSVTGLVGMVDKVRVTVNGVSHSFPNDLNLLLVGPQGNSVLLMSHTGGGHAVTNLNLTFDGAASDKMPKSATLRSGTYLPTRYDTDVVFLPPAPATPYGLGLDTLNGTDPNGVWSLFVLDDSKGDSGSISGGYALEITTIQTVNPIADLGVTMVSGPEIAFVGGFVTNVVTVVNNGPSTAVDVVAVNTLAAGVNYISASASQGTVAGTNEASVVALLGSIASGASATVEIVTAPFLGGDVRSWASVSSANIDLSPGNNGAQTVVVVYAAVDSTLTGAVVNGQFELEVTAQASLTYRIEASTDLVNWTVIHTTVAPLSGIIKFSDPVVEGAGQKFYRSVRGN